MIVRQSTTSFTGKFESCILHAYQDIAGVWTIGWGTTIYPDGKHVQKGESIPQAWADYLLENKLNQIAAYIAVHIRSELNQNQVDAVLDFCYNVGVPAFMGSTLLRKINADPTDITIKDAFLMWDKAHIDGQLVEVKGLKERRKEEGDKYFT